MTYILLTEGTGKGVHERTNVSALAEMCVGDDAQRVHLERGPGTRFGAIITGHVFGLGAIYIAQRHCPVICPLGFLINFSHFPGVEIRRFAK